MTGIVATGRQEHSAGTLEYIDETNELYKQSHSRNSAYGITIQNRIYIA